MSRHRRSSPAVPLERATASDSTPFPPSWLDRLEAWIEGRRVPVWAVYLVIAIGLSLLLHLPLWSDRSVPLGTLDVNQLTAADFPVYFFGLIHYLNSTARKALASYRPLLDLGDQEYASLEYTLTHVPRRLGVLALLLGVFFGPLSFFSSPADWGVKPTFSILSQATLLFTALVMYVAVVYWTIQVVRQARTIDRIHKMTKRLDIFRRDPVYSFSSLTLRSALGPLLAAYSYIFIALYLGLAAVPTTVDWAIIGAAVAIALAIFFLPLNRMHSLLAAEKQHVLREMDDRYSRLLERFNRQLDTGRYGALNSTSTAITALSAQRDVAARVSTWPWKPETLRSLLSTLALPVILYLLSRLLGRLLGV